MHNPVITIHLLQSSESLSFSSWSESAVMVPIILDIVAVPIRTSNSWLSNESTYTKLPYVSENEAKLSINLMVKLNIGFLLVASILAWKWQESHLWVAFFAHTNLVTVGGNHITNLLGCAIACLHLPLTVVICLIGVLRIADLRLCLLH
jgi:hypothetical protein